ncbi:MAG: hypothetical protein ACE5KI_08925 [Dehalococcoidia bacterium]
MSELLNLGAKVPDFNLIATDGSTYSLYDNLGDQGTVITFFRGEW